MSNSKQAPAVEPRGCFQVFALRKYMTSTAGYHNFRAAFHSLLLAKAYAARLAQDRDFYTGYEWVQVADVMSGKVWDYEDGEWSSTQDAANDVDGK